MPPTADAGPSPCILLYVDDTRQWHGAARLIGRIVASGGGRVVVTSSLLLPRSRAAALEEARALLDLPAGRVSLRPRPGLVEYVLPELAREEAADLVVVGRLGGLDRVTGGLIGGLVVKRTPASVLLVRGEPSALRRILVCTEGGARGDASVEQAARIARAFGASLDVLHVVNAMGLTERGQEELEENLRDFVRSDAPEAAHLRANESRLGELELEGRILVRPGLVVPEILAVAQDGYDLLVVGAHDVASPRSALYEDFAGLLVRQSPISICVVRPHAS